MRSWIVPLVLVILVSSCLGIYEDQVGMSDWSQQYIGRVTHAAFTQGSGRKRVVVATDKSAVASMNLRTGEIFWRQVLEESQPIDDLDIILGKYAVSLSRGGYLRSWYLPDGALAWETLLDTSDSPSKLLVLPIDLNNDKATDMVVLQEGAVYAVSSADGRIIWKTDLPNDRLSGLSLSIVGGNLYAAGISGSSLALFRLDSSSGAVTKLETTEAFDCSGLTLIGDVVVALDSDGVNLATGVLSGDEAIDLQKTSVATLIPSSTGAAKLLPVTVPGACALSVDGSAVILRLRGTGLEVGETVQGLTAVSDGITIDDQGAGAFSVVGHLDSSELSVRVLSANDWTPFSEEKIQLGGNRGSIQKVFLNAYTRTDRSRGYRVLVVGEDDSLSLLQQEKVVWTREDGLASIEDATMAELPLEKTGSSVAEVEHDVAEWLKGHILRLKASLLLANSDEQAALQAVRLNNAEKTKMVRDHNGFRKLIIAMTRSGKIYALHTGDGRIVWSLLIPNFGRGTFKLYPWKTPHHLLDESPVTLVLGRSSAGNGVAAWVDLHTGVQLGALELPYSIKQAMALPLVDSNERRLHMLIDEENRAHVYPATDEALTIFERSKRDVHFYLTKEEEGTIEGFSIKSRIDTSDDSGHVFSTEKIWTVVFPDSEVITATASRRADEVVHTQSKVLGNRDVWYKYLNKNVLFVATVTPQDSRAINPEESWLFAYLIDTVTGHVLHRVSHSHATGPVHAVFNENWVVYYFFNVRSYKHEVSVLEVYDKSSEGKDVMQIVLGRHNATELFSSFSPRNLDVKSQSYFFPWTVKTMTVTATGKGITGKQILVGTLGNQVIALDKRFLDPRRSLSPTPSEREEGIIPLTEGIPIFPQSYLSHSTRVESLRGILSVPARLESTCLVFTHGIDLFFARTAPSRIYDSLTEDFSYALLLITMVALLIAIGISMVLSQRKELREKWK